MQCGGNNYIICWITDVSDVDCGDLSNPANGIVTFNLTTYWSPAIYSCNEGFELMGEEERRCLADDMWSGEAPTCVEEGECLYQTFSFLDTCV